MKSRLRQHLQAVVEKLPKHPVVRLVAMLLAAFVAIVGAVKSARDIWPPERGSSATPASSPATPRQSAASPPNASSPEMPQEPGYAGLWAECIPAVLRAGVSEIDDTPPSQQQLNASLVFWSGNGWAKAPKCVAKLLHAGADPDSVLPSEFGYASGPALHTALNQRRWENALILLRAGAKPNLKTIYHPDSPDGMTALEMASMAPSNIKDEIVARGGIRHTDLRSAHSPQSP
jgi:hypothetical protein